MAQGLLRFFQNFFLWADNLDCQRFYSVYYLCYYSALLPKANIRVKPTHPTSSHLLLPLEESLVLQPSRGEPGWRFVTPYPSKNAWCCGPSFTGLSLKGQKPG